MLMPALNFSSLKQDIIHRIETGGSAREFYRCKYRNRTAVLVVDPEIRKYLRIHEYLKRRRINVPRLYWTDDSKSALFEDLGTRSLCAAYRKNPTLRYYRKTIDMLVKMQTARRGEFPVADCYDREHIKWEQNYFKKHYLVRHCRVDRPRIKELDREFNELTGRLLEAARGNSGYFMHRDFQSQNIYIKDGKPHVIDFQSARIGPVTYDLSSLLRDPYVDLTVRQERQLFDYYYDRSIRRARGSSYEKLRALYRLTCVQRSMQALGA